MKTEPIQVGQLVKKAQAGVSLRESSKLPFLQKVNNEYSLSTYRGELRPETVAKSVAKIKAAFPALTPEFFTLLIDRLKEKGFTDERLNDAVNNVIDKCQYPTPTLANFLSFDSRVKVYDYYQLCTMVDRQEASLDSFDKIKINGKLFWVRKSDKSLYNVPDEL